MKKLHLWKYWHTGIVWRIPALALRFSRLFFKKVPQSLAKTVSHSLKGAERENHRFRGCEEGDDQ